FDSRPRSCSCRFTEALFTQMNLVGCRFAGDGAHRPASRISLTSASGTIPSLNFRTARRVRMSAPTDVSFIWTSRGGDAGCGEWRVARGRGLRASAGALGGGRRPAQNKASLVGGRQPPGCASARPPTPGQDPPFAQTRSRLHDHFQRPIDSLIECAQRLAEVRELEMMRDQLARWNSSIRHQWDDFFHRISVRAHAVKIDLFENDLLEVDRRRLLGYPRECDATAFADHPDRLTYRVLGPGRIDGDVGAEPAGHLADAGDGIAVVVVDDLEAQAPSALQAFASADHDAPSRAEDLRAHRGQQAHATRPDRDEHVARLDPRTLHR